MEYIDPEIGPTRKVTYEELLEDWRKARAKVDKLYLEVFQLEMIIVKLATDLIENGFKRFTFENSNDGEANKVIEILNKHKVGE